MCEHKGTTPDKGFTLVEMIITLTVAAILLSLAVPSFRNMIMNNRVKADTNELLADINYARSEAVKRGSRVGICRTNNPKAGNPCAQGSDWEDGWIVFDDENDPDGQPENADDILKIHSPIEDVNDSTLQGNRNSFMFLPTGRLNNNNGTVRRCDERGFTDAREIVVALSGSIRTVRHDPDETPCDPTRNICTGECPADP